MDRAGRRTAPFSHNVPYTPSIVGSDPNLPGYCWIAATGGAFAGFSDTPDHTAEAQQYFRNTWERLDNYLVIGHNGSGDPVCIDLVTGNEIVYLNHDNSFERIFMNTTVEQFSHCLLLYKLFYASLINATDPYDFSIRKFSDTELHDLQTDFMHIDAKALDPASFWKTELDALVWERDH